MKCLLMIVLNPILALESFRVFWGEILAKEVLSWVVGEEEVREAVGLFKHL